MKILYKIKNYLINSKRRIYDKTEGCYYQLIKLFKKVLIINEILPINDLHQNLKDYIIKNADKSK